VIEQAVLMSVLDRPQWTRDALGSVLDDIDPGSVDAALEAMTDAGVAVVDGDTITASPCARYLDRLNVITI